MKTLFLTFCAVLAFSNARVLDSGFWSRMGGETYPTGRLTTEEIYGRPSTMWENEDLPLSYRRREFPILEERLMNEMSGFTPGMTDRWGSPIVTRNPYLQRLLQRNVVPRSLVNVPLRSEVMRNIDMERTVPEMLIKNKMNVIKKEIVSEKLGLPVDTIVGNMEIPQTNIIQHQLIKKIIKNEVLALRGSLPVDIIERQIESGSIEHEVALMIVRKLVKDIERNVALSRVYGLPVGSIKRPVETSTIFEKLVFLANVEGCPLTQLLSKLARTTLSEIEEVIAKRTSLLVSPKTLEELTLTNPMSITELTKFILSGEEEVLALRYGVPVEIIRREIQVPVTQALIELVKEIEKVLVERGIPLGWETAMERDMDKLSYLSNVIDERRGLERSMMPFETRELLGGVIDRDVAIKMIMELVRDIKRNVELSSEFGLPTIRRTMGTPIFERLVRLAKSEGCPLAKIARKTLLKIEEIVAKKINLLVSSEKLELRTMTNPMSISELTRIILSGEEEILALRYGVPIEIIKREIQLPVIEKLMEFVEEIEHFLVKRGIPLRWETSVDMPMERLTGLSRFLGEREGFEGSMMPFETRELFGNKWGAIEMIKDLVKDIERNVELSRVFGLSVGTVRRTMETTPIFERLVYLAKLQGCPFAKLARKTLFEIEEVITKKISLFVSPEILERLTTTNPMSISELTRWILSGRVEILAQRYGVPVEIIKREIVFPVTEILIEFVSETKQMLARSGVSLGFETPMDRFTTPFGTRFGPYSVGYSLYGMGSGRSGMGSWGHGWGMGYPMMGLMGKGDMNRPLWFGSQL